MGNKPVEFHEEASSEFEAAFNWYLERSESVAMRFAIEVDQAVAEIYEAPHRWPTGVHGTHRFLLRRFPFAIIYRELPSTVQVLAVAHGRRRPSYWKERL